MRIFFFAVIFLTGCASIIDDDRQTITVITSEEEAKCTLQNSQGTFIINQTPGTITVNTICKPMTVICELEGYQTSQIEVEHTHKAAAWGNVLAGGIIGYGIDRLTGAACQYPQSIIVPLKKNGLDAVTNPDLDAVTNPDLDAVTNPDTENTS